MFKEESRSTLNCLMDVHVLCDAVPKCLEQEQDVMPAGLLPLRALLGVTALAGFLGCLWGLCQKVHWKVLILLAPGLAATKWVLLLFLLTLR